MAAAPSTLQDGISEILECSICLELFTRPKVLPCQHTFCQDCLWDHAGRGGTFQCPNCREEVEVPPQGVTGFPNNLIAANMCERLQKQATLSGETSEQAQFGNRCRFHPSKGLKFYCKLCQIRVCEKCSEEAHNGHGTTTITEAAQERIPAVQALITEGRNILGGYHCFIKGLGETEKTLERKKQETDNGITQAYNQMVQKLTERKNYLLSEAVKKHKKNLEKIQTERDRVSADTNELSAACDQAEQEMEKKGNDFLSQETILTLVVGKYRGKAAPTPVQTQPAVFQPTNSPVPVLGHVKAQSSPSAPIPAAPVARGKGHHHGNQKESVQSLTPAPILPLRTRRAPASSNVAARGTGHHHGNQRQKELPLQRVTFGRKGSATGEFDCPTGIAVSEKGEIFVADSVNQRIQVFTLQGTFVRQFPTEMPDEQMLGQGSPLPPMSTVTTTIAVKKYIRPCDVAMDRVGRLWVVRSIGSTNLAVQYSKQGGVLRKISLKNTWWDRGVAMDTRRNRILVTEVTGEWPNLCAQVQVFRPDGTLERTVDHLQSIGYPQYMNITVDGAGRILVSDWDNHSVYVYNKAGGFLFQFGSKGSGEGQLKWPRGICTDRAGNIIVADWGNSRVEMFDKRGTFLKHIATDMEEPNAVAMATQGQLVVTDCRSHTVTIFSNF